MQLHFLSLLEWLLPSTVAFLLGMMFIRGTASLLWCWRVGLCYGAFASCWLTMDSYLTGGIYSWLTGAISILWCIAVGIFTLKVICEIRYRRAIARAYQITKSQFFGNLLKDDPQAAARLVGGHWEPEEG